MYPSETGGKFSSHSGYHPTYKDILTVSEYRLSAPFTLKSVRHFNTRYKWYWLVVKVHVSEKVMLPLEKKRSRTVKLILLPTN